MRIWRAWHLEALYLVGPPSTMGLPSLSPAKDTHLNVLLDIIGKHSATVTQHVSKAFPPPIQVTEPMEPHCPSLQIRRSAYDSEPAREVQRIRPGPLLDGCQVKAPPGPSRGRYEAKLCSLHVLKRLLNLLSQKGQGGMINQRLTSHPSQPTSLTTPQHLGHKAWQWHAMMAPNGWVEPNSPGLQRQHHFSVNGAAPSVPGSGGNKTHP